MRIRTRLLLALLLLGATAVLAASAIGYRNARSSMIEAAERQLTGVRRAKAFAVASYFRTVTNHVRTLSEAMMFVQGMEEFRAAFREIDGPEVPPDLKNAVSAYYREVYLPALADLVTPRSSLDDYLPLGRGPYYAQYWYLVNNPAPPGRKQELDRAADGSRYSEVHARFHPSYRRLVERFGYADLMLVDDRTGRVVYTVMKQPDLGTSLVKGPYRGTGLAAAFEKCRSGCWCSRSVSRNSTGPSPATAAGRVTASVRRATPGSSVPTSGCARTRGASSKTARSTWRCCAVGGYRRTRWNGSGPTARRPCSRARGSPRSRPRCEEKKGRSGKSA